MQSDETVLFVSPGPNLSNPASGEGTRLRNLSRELSERGWRVITLVPEETGDFIPEWVTQQYMYTQWSFSHLTDLNPSLVGNLRRVFSRENIDVTHLSTGVCAAKALTLVNSDTAVIYAAQNVEADHAQDFINPELSIHKRLLGPQLIPLIERARVYCADGLMTVSEKDRGRFIERYGLDKKTIKPVPTGTVAVNRDRLNNPSDVRDRFEIDANAVVVFHGYYQHPPNREAAELIDKEIAPAMTERNIDISFLLVGKDPPEVLSPNVHAVGFVDDLLSVLNAADAAVIPILHGGGTKTKLYDYVSLSLPIVATRKATEGVDLEHQKHALLTHNVDENFISNVIKIIEQHELRNEMQDHLTRLSEEWNWKTSGECLANLYDDIK